MYSFLKSSKLKYPTDELKSGDLNDFFQKVYKPIFNFDF